MMLQALLGLEIDALNGRATFRWPRLPDCIDTLKLKSVSVGDAQFDATIQNHIRDVSVQISKRGELKVSIEN
jgi:hypothetical protein